MGPSVSGALGLGGVLGPAASSLCLGQEGIQARAAGARLTGARWWHAGLWDAGAGIGC